MSGLALMTPEALLLATAVAVLFADAIYPRRARAAAWMGAAGSAIAAAAAWAGGLGSVALFGGQFQVDGAAQVARVATCVLTGVFLVWLAGNGLRGGGERTFASLVLFSALGALLMAGARDWVVLLLSLEVATMPAYVLIGFERRGERGLEGALKYFLISMIASALFLYGVSFVIGMSGSTAMRATHLEPGLVGAVAAAFVAAGLLAKLSAAPFQFWAPDAYAGAPAAAVGFVSAVPKIAGFLAFARVVQAFGSQTAALTPVLIGAALLSMLLGNLAAYPQSDIRRLMAYSGIAHAGYLLVGLAAGTAAGLSAGLFYAIAYAVPSMGVMLAVAAEGDELADLRGLGSRRPWAAWSVVVMLLSLVGVPPLAGFIGKLYLFTAAMGAGLVPLAVFGIVMSAVSAGFYFRIIRAMFFERAAAPEAGAGHAVGEGAHTAEAEGASAGAGVRPAGRLAPAVVVAIAVATLAIGIASGPLLGAIAFGRL